jgi:hypothetical protein
LYLIFGGEEAEVDAETGFKRRPRITAEAGVAEVDWDSISSLLLSRSRAVVGPDAIEDGKA